MSFAYDLGISHFDVARSYGFGRAEGILGKFLRGKRLNITVTTKFGVVPPTLSRMSRALVPLARSLGRLSPKISQALRRKSGELLIERRFDSAYLSNCLHASLTELNTDYIDIYLLHEPLPLVKSNAEDIIAMLLKFIAQGKICRWGLAYRNPRDHLWGSCLEPEIVQADGNIDTLSDAKHLGGPSSQTIITRPFFGGIQKWDDRRNGQDDLATKLMAVEFRKSDIPAVSLALARRLSGSNGSVVCSMFTPAHIIENVGLISSIDRDSRIRRIVEMFVAMDRGTGIALG